MNNSIAILFEKSDPIVRDIYTKLLTELVKLGQIIEDPKKTSIHLKNKTGFAGIHPRKSYLILNVVSSNPIKSPRIMKQEQVSKSRFHNELKLEDLKDVDSEVITWLKEAYLLMS